MSTPKSPFERLVDDLHSASQLQTGRVILVKSMHPGLAQEARRANARERGVDKRIEAASNNGGHMPTVLMRKILDAQHARRLLPGDIDRASSAIELGKPVPRDVLARILGDAS